MKKIITSIFIAFMMIITIIPVNALEENKSIEYLSNGDYIETTIVSNINTRARSSKSGTKTEKYKNASGEVMWSVSVTGTFSYNGSSCTCTNATVSTTKPSSSWSLSNKKASKSGNKAIASVTGKKISAGTSVTRTVTLTCSPTGKLS